MEPSSTPRVSGRYAGRGDGYQVELRVDVDGDRPMRRVSADYFQIRRGKPPHYHGSVSVDAPAVAVTASGITITGKARSTWQTGADRVRVTIPRSNAAAQPALIARFDRLIRSIARSYRLGPADVDDVVQVAWTQLYRHIDRVRDPRAVAGWLATTTRREAMRVLQKHVVEQLTDDPELGDAPDALVIAAEQRALLARAVAALPECQRALMTLLAVQPDARYEHISTTLKMPVGSIGPTRARGLMTLSHDRGLRNHHLSVV